jgi:hypothetical protein
LEVGRQCSPNGKFPDWCAYQDGTGYKGRCSFSEFRKWMTDKGGLLVKAIELPEPEPLKGVVASLQSINEMRRLQGQPEVSGLDYARRLAADRLPEQQAVDDEITELKKRMVKHVPQPEQEPAEPDAPQPPQPRPEPQPEPQPEPEPEPEPQPQGFDASAVLMAPLAVLIRGIKAGEYDDHLDALSEAEQAGEARRRVLAALKRRR